MSTNQRQGFKDYVSGHFDSALDRGLTYLRQERYDDLRFAPAEEARLKDMLRRHHAELIEAIQSAAVVKYGPQHVRLVELS